MYQRYADLHGWKTEVISISENDLGGYREIVASVMGKGVFARLKFESGVHRVQRIPATESGGRIHASAATVAVLPETEDIDIDIKTEDIPYRHDAGGRRRRPARQQDGRAARIDASADRASWSCRREVTASEPAARHAGAALAPVRLYEREKADSERSQARKSQVGSGDRSAAHPDL